MKTATHILLTATLILLIGFWNLTPGQTTQTAQPAPRRSDAEVKSLIDRIEHGANNFKSSLSDALNQGQFKSTLAEDMINEFVKEFEGATNTLKERFSDNNAATGAVQEVLQRSVAINNFMARHPLTPTVQSDWKNLRTNLNELSRVYQVTWIWPGVAARRPYRLNDQQMEELLERIEKKSDDFRAVMKSSLEHSSLDDTKAEDIINQFVKDFEIATDRLEGSFDDNFSTTGAAAEVLRRAVIIDGFLQRNKLTPSSHSAWLALRGELDALARSYNFGLDWRAPTILIRIESLPEQIVGKERKP